MKPAPPRPASGACPVTLLLWDHACDPIRVSCSVERESPACPGRGEEERGPPPSAGCGSGRQVPAHLAVVPGNSGNSGVKRLAPWRPRGPPGNFLYRSLQSPRFPFASVPGFLSHARFRLSRFTVSASQLRRWPPRGARALRTWPAGLTAVGPGDVTPPLWPHPPALRLSPPS